MREALDEKQRIVYQIVVPTIARTAVLRRCHDQAGHWAYNRTAALLRHEYYWPGWSLDLKHYLATCPQCTQRANRAIGRTPALRRYLVAEPMMREGMDILDVGIESSRGNRYVLVIVDYFSKWP